MNLVPVISPHHKTNDPSSQRFWLSDLGDHPISLAARSHMYVFPHLKTKPRSMVRSLTQLNWGAYWRHVLAAKRILLRGQIITKAQKRTPVDITTIAISVQRSIITQAWILHAYYNLQKRYKPAVRWWTGCNTAKSEPYPTDQHHTSLCYNCIEKQNAPHNLANVAKFIPETPKSGMKINLLLVGQAPSPINISLIVTWLSNTPDCRRRDA